MILIGTPLVAFPILLAFKQPVATALIIAAGMAQIGEFSFILVGLGVGLDLLDERIRDLVLGASILSIFLNPILFFAVNRFNAWAEQRKSVGVPPTGEAAVPVAERPISALRDHAILAGYGRVGTLVADGLLAAGWTLLVIEAGDAAVEALQNRGVEVIVGNAADPEILRSANLARGRLLVVAIPDAFEARQDVMQARADNPTIDIVARAHFDAEVDHLSRVGARKVVMGEREVARAMLEYAIAGNERPAETEGTAAADGG